MSVCKQKSGCPPVTQKQCWFQRMAPISMQDECHRSNPPKPRSNGLNISRSNAQHSCSVKSSVRLSTCSVLLSRVWWRSKMSRKPLNISFVWGVVERCSVSWPSYWTLLNSRMLSLCCAFTCCAPILHKKFIVIFFTQNLRDYYGGSCFSFLRLVTPFWSAFMPQ